MLVLPLGRSRVYKHARASLVRYGHESRLGPRGCTPSIAGVMVSPNMFLLPRISELTNHRIIESSNQREDWDAVGGIPEQSGPQPKRKGCVRRRDEFHILTSILQRGMHLSRPDKGQQDSRRTRQCMDQSGSTRALKMKQTHTLQSRSSVMLT